MTEQSSMISGASSRLNKDGSKRNIKSDIIRTRQVELALAISIILSNLSNDENYIEILLGVDRLKKSLFVDGQDYELDREN